ncbi:hypothetical protein Goklo_028373 [Gossypium klotzschianum]|uniref:Uncharacterized protein n=1 Tax=Gossypium klotzschianum TaxID=34286 RepID=A0A7J8U1M0_9ROSI|nr:hypothetical protein [Gossypium klotzschianum]
MTFVKKLMIFPRALGT